MSERLLTVIMPAFNEGRNIYANLQRVCRTLEPLDYEIVLVDDGSSDDTRAESLRVASDGVRVQVQSLPTNQGKGAALYHGFQYASGQYVAFLDADMDIDPCYVPVLLERMRAEQADGVISAKANGQRQVPLLRRVMSVVYRGMVKVLFGLAFNETQTGLKIFRRQVLELCIPRLRVRRFAFDVELMVAATRFGFRIIEAPVEVRFQRKSSLERIRPRQIARMFVDTLSIYYHSSFWVWLSPALSTKAWMAAFVLGVLLLGIGIGKLITPLVLSEPFKQVVYIAALQFLPPVLRDWLLVIGGALIIALTLYKLNASLLNAFARKERKGLAEILGRGRSGGKE